MRFPDNAFRHDGVIALLLVGGMLAFCLPWIWHPAAAHSPSLLDVAEWTTLQPEARNGAFPLLSSFFLRVSLSLMSVLVVIEALRLETSLLRWLLGCGVTLLVVRSLPPVEFWTAARSDMNYQQQFYLTLATVLVIGVAIAVCRQSRQSHLFAATVLVALLLAVSCGLGLVRSFEFYRGLAMPVNVGIGGLALISIACLLAAESAYQLWMQKKGSTSG